MDYDRKIIPLGDGASLVATWLNDQGFPTDPDIQVMYLTPPGSITPTYYLLPGDNIFSQIDVGVWVFPFSEDRAGLWHWRWEAHGAVHDVWEGEIRILASANAGATQPAIPTGPQAPATSPPPSSFVSGDAGSGSVAGTGGGTTPP